METKEITLSDGKKVTIWSMNFGFKSDLQSVVSQVTVRTKEELKVDIGQLQVYTLIYGIYESVDLGIDRPRNIKLGLEPDEITKRKMAVRSIEVGADMLYKEINDFNKEVDEKLLKKSATS